MIFQIHVIALVFMCCGWSINWVKTILELIGIPLHLGFLWNTLKKTIALPEDKTTRVEAWVKDLMALNKTTQGNLECFVHYRNLQRSFLISLKKGRNHFRSVSISHQLVGELNWWASGGMRANRISPWHPPIPTLQIWTDASLYAGGGKTDGCSHFQHTWSEQ